MLRYDDYPPRHRPSGVWPALGGMFVAALLVYVILWSFGVIHWTKEAPAAHNPNYQERIVAPRSERSSDETERILIYKSTTPSVVNVDTLAYTVNRFDSTEEQQRQGTGTGFIWDEDGRIVTNFHVVRDALALNSKNDVIINPDRRIMVTMANGETSDVRLVGIAPDSDLAVIQLVRLPASGVKKIEVGTSSDLEVGQTVYAIGSPFGQMFSLTNGIISALHREIQSPSNHIISDAIQTNAALNPGNSGGPLLDKDGRLIGVNTAITSPSGGNVGIGYSIPVDTVNRVVTDIIRTGRVAQPYLGANFVLHDALVRNAGYPKGAEVVGVADLQGILKRVKVGETLSLTILRNGEQEELRVKIEGI